MTIRAIAQELYRCQKKVHALEEQLEKAEYKDQATIQEELRVARAELKQLKNMIEGRKAQSTSPFSRSPFPWKK